MSEKRKREDADFLEHASKPGFIVYQRGKWGENGVYSKPFRGADGKIRHDREFLGHVLDRGLGVFESRKRGGLFTFSVERGYGEFPPRNGESKPTPREEALRRWFEERMREGDVISNSSSTSGGVHYLKINNEERGLYRKYDYDRYGKARCRKIDLGKVVDRELGIYENRNRGGYFTFSPERGFGAIPDRNVSSPLSSSDTAVLNRLEELAKEKDDLLKNHFPPDSIRCYKARSKEYAWHVEKISGSDGKRRYVKHLIGKVVNRELGIFEHKKRGGLFIFSPERGFGSIPELLKASTLSPGEAAIIQWIEERKKDDGFFLKIPYMRGRISYYNTPSGENAMYVTYLRGPNGELLAKRERIGKAIDRGPGIFESRKRGGVFTFNPERGFGTVPHRNRATPLTPYEEAVLNRIE
ncbi:MAG: hypothetical protein LBR53_07220 [Deltaproteobacteria bacterium]|jgi:hypothetical protein|nr:hypothetical protein [Deltaproteobacteria bacterium]